MKRIIMMVVVSVAVVFLIGCSKSPESGTGAAPVPASGGIVSAPKQEEIASSFEKRVNEFENFFSSKPKLLDKQSFKKSPTGYIFKYHHFDNYKISYDIRKTDSLVSPYMGYITLIYLESISTKCGDFRDTILKEKFFTTIELARQKRDDESCYKRTPIEFKDKFIFAFQKNQWVFKEVLNLYNNKPDPLFNSAFGINVQAERHTNDDNNFWKKLIE